MPPILISLSSFGAAEIGRHGQLWCARLAQAAGADSVEVRGELLRDPRPNCRAGAAFASVYSSPEGLWAEGGLLDSAALARGLARGDHARRAAAQDVDRRLSRVLARLRCRA